MVTFSLLIIKVKVAHVYMQKHNMCFILGKQMIISCTHRVLKVTVPLWPCGFFVTVPLYRYFYRYFTR